MSTRIMKALANEHRLQVMKWLKDPAAHFSPQGAGDLVKDGVCGVQIAEKLGITQATLSVHIGILVDVGLLRAKRIQKWIFYQRNEKRIAAIKEKIFVPL